MRSLIINILLSINNKNVKKFNILFNNRFQYMYRNTLREASMPKISVKQLNPIKEQSRVYHTTFNPNEKGFQYPPNHIESQTSESFDPSYHYEDVASTRLRRRKIFERKVIKATVIPLQFQQKNNRHFSNQFEISPQSPQYLSPNNHLLHSQTNQYEQFQTLRSRQNEEMYRKQHGITFKPVIQNQNSQIETFRTVNNVKNPNISSRFHDQQHSNIEYGHDPSQRSKTDTNKSPLFAQNQSNQSRQTSQYKSKLDEATLKSVSKLPDQLIKIKEELLNQKQQISEINQKILKVGKQNFRKQKELLGILIQKQNQLTRKQQQLNETLQNMSRIQIQNDKRHQQLLKCELELQRSKRIQQLSRENERLYQQIIKNNSRDTKDSINDVTPLSHPVNMQNYFRDRQMEKEISALYTPYKIDEENDDYDNTLRELLSPLEINPDADF